MPAKVRLNSRNHSGRIRPHEHTSYLALAVLVLLVGAFLAVLTVSSFASASPGPQSSSISLTGEMPGPPPSTGASITYPTDSATFQNTPITVSGTCPSGTLVEIYKNDIFAGSTPCNNNGGFSVQVDLLYGQNSLTAVDYNDLNEAGPTSKAVNVTYNVQTPPVSSLLNINFTATQLLLETSAVYRGTFPGQELYVPIKILGGVAPFAVNVNWGDNSNQVIPSSINQTVNADHVYKSAGIYKISIQASDSQNRLAFLNVAAIINGQAGSVAGSSNTSSGPSANKFLVLWPLYAIAATLVVSFWLGEKREKHVLADKLKPVPTLGTSVHTNH
jgi:hypothetical protein